MAIPVEQFTAPGKYYFDLAMEKAKLEIENQKPMYIGLTNYPSKTALFKDNPHYKGIKKK